jgi:hypothetical protein
MWISFVRIGNGNEKYVEEVIPSEWDVDVRYGCEMFIDVDVNVRWKDDDVDISQRMKW